MTTLLTARRPSSWVVAPLLAAVLLSGCSQGTADDTASTPAQGGAASSSPTATAPESPTPEPSAADAAPADTGPEASFHTWLAASRAPDAATACAYMTPELTQRLVDQLSAQGVPGVSDCASLITMTAGLYAASGQSSETTVELREQTADSAVLHVTYVAGSSCGLVVMRPGPGHWLLDERSSEEC